MTDDLLQATVSVRGIICSPRNKILILQRATDDGWELPGGRLATDENPVEGLKREIVEETGLTIEVAEIVAANSWVNSDEQDRLAIHYKCYSTKQPIEMSEEHVDWRWIAPTEVHKLLCEPQTAAVRASTEFSSQTA